MGSWNFEVLPFDVQRGIFDYLDFDSLSNLRVVSSLLSKAVDKYAILRYEQLLKEYSNWESIKLAEKAPNIFVKWRWANFWLPDCSIKDQADASKLLRKIFPPNFGDRYVYPMYE